MTFRRALLLMPAALLLVSSGAAAPAAAQDASPAAGDLCLLSLEEVNQATGLTFDTTTPVEGECTYETALSDAGIITITLRLEDGELEPLREIFTEGGQDLTVAGLPAWGSDVGLWVDIGARLFVVQPVVFVENPPEAMDLAVPVAEIAVPRLPADAGQATPEPSEIPEPSFLGDAELAALFPTELAGQAADVTTLTGEEFLGQVDQSDPDAVEGMGQLEAALAAQGKTLAEMSFGSMFVYNSETEAGGSLYAIRVRGGNGAALLDPLKEILNSDIEQPEESQVEIAGKQVLAVGDAANEGTEPRHFYASGEVLWIAQFSESLLEELFGKLP